MLILKKTGNFKNLISTFILLVLLASLFPPVGLAAEPQRITWNALEQSDPAVSDRAIAWQDYRNPLNVDDNNIDIWTYPLPQGPETPITGIASQENPAISGDKIVYQAFVVYHKNLGIYLYDRSTNETKILTSSPGALYPDIDGERVVYQDSNGNNIDIYLYNLSTGKEIGLTTNPSVQRYPKISGNKVVWVDSRNLNTDIYLYDFVTAEEKRITADPSNQFSADISEDIIVWEDSRNGEADIYMYDLKTGQESAVTTAPSPQSNPRIYGNKIVYEDKRNGNSDIYMKNLTTRIEVPLATHESDQLSPEINGNKVVWQDLRNDSGDIYLKELDSSSPSTPASLIAAGMNSSTVGLSWIPSSDNEGVSGYKVERSTDGVNFSEVATVLSNSYADMSLPSSTTHWYRVRAYDIGGNASDYSNVAQAATQAPNNLDSASPSDPSGLVATAMSPSRIDLSWNASTDNEGVAGYKVERSTDGLNFSEVETVLINSYSDMGLSPSTTYWYRVRAYDGTGNVSGYSNIFAATTHAENNNGSDGGGNDGGNNGAGADSVSPSKPSNPFASAQSISQISFYWGASTDNKGVAGYKIERSLNDQANWTEIGVTQATSYSDTGLNPATTAYYRVRAYDAVGNVSGYSNIASATTPSLPLAKSVGRLWGITSTDTAIAICEMGFPNGSKVALVARDDYFTDALAGGPLAKYVSYKYGSSAPILLTNTNYLTNETRAEIQRLGAEKIYLLGGAGAVKEGVESDLGAISGVREVKRLWGETAYGTAQAIKDEMVSISGEVSGSPKPDTAIITTGENFPDSLVISGPAASKNMPILLVKPFTDEPQPETKQALQGIKNVIIAGGPGAVHPDLEHWLNLNKHTVTKRLWGLSEYDTAVDVASSGNSIFNFNKSTTLVTRGDYFTDALAGGAYASGGPYPMVLVNTSSIPAVTNIWLTGYKDQINMVYILGGWGAVSDGVLGQIEGTIK